VNPIERNQMSQALVADINAVLMRHGITSVMSLQDLVITDKVVSDLVINDAPLSEALIRHLWPSIREDTVYHYTSKAAAESIATSQVFRFYSLTKRHTENEVEAFCTSHGLQGYLELDASGVPKYKSLILPNTFYASFASSNIKPEEEQYFWSTFAHSDGARLKIKVKASNPNYRCLIYGDTTAKPIPVLAELDQKILGTYQRHFVLKGISRLCAFYLSSGYAKENERRALYRTWSGYGPHPKSDGKHEYIELPLGAMSETGYHLDLLEIQSDEALNIPSIYTVVKRNS